jgi:alpha-tubulin suppressor-like RCC1 family protein
MATPTIRWSRSSRLAQFSLSLLALLPLAASCSDMQDPVSGGGGSQPVDPTSPTSPTSGDDTQSIELALTTVPAGVQCVNIVAAIGGQNISRTFTLTAGASSATLTLGQLPAGTASLRGNAFNVACTALTGATATYVADPLTIMVRPGVVTSAELTFRPNNPVGVSVNFLGNVAEVAVGWFASFARMTDGTLRFWGGDQTLGTQLLAAPLPASFGLTNVTQISVGQNTGCVLKTDGSVICWGFVNDGNVRIPPTQVTLPGPALQIAATRGHYCAAMQFGTVACWGSDNASGQIGSGGTAPVPLTAPAIVPLNNQAGVGRLALGDGTSCVVDSSGHATCWGDNSAGQFGNGTTTSSLTPVSAAVGLGAITDLKVGSGHACAVRADGALFCWGTSFSGQVGDGTTNQIPVPKRITLPPIAQVAAGEIHTCAVTTAGDLYCWGSNNAGQLGDGTGIDQLSPVQVLSGVSAVRANASFHTCAEMQDLTVRCWGFNNIGQLGNGSMLNSSIPSNVRLQ